MVYDTYRGILFLIYDFICFEERLMKNDYSI